ncbi:hypothetical protein [Lichenibacterium dinghuense]|uniref:hypothetical protein n=1 Tax=Lichenibacterium dinghuense TaxID=2895977 RepID=UPI001F2B6F56|nr:hypothetical protein [Lichenibacterium sp. 6Y81]
MYRYAEVEDALIAVAGVPESYRTALRARLKNLSRLGVKKEAPGKGTRVSYDFDDVCLWAFCLELAQFGMDPARVAMMAYRLWLSVGPVLTGGQHDEDMIFAANPVFLSREAQERHDDRGKTDQGLFQIDWNENSVRMVYPASELAAVVCSAPKRTSRLPNRTVLVNLSDLRRRIEDALAKVREV